MSDIVPTFCGLTAEEIQDLKQRVENAERAATYETDIAEQALSAMKELQQRNVELEVQVVQLKSAITTALHGTVFDEISNRDVDGLVPYGETKTAIAVLTDALCNLSKIQQAKGE